MADPVLDEFSKMLPVFCFVKNDWFPLPLGHIVVLPGTAFLETFYQRPSQVAMKLLITSLIPAELDVSCKEYHYIEKPDFVEFHGR